MDNQIELNKFYIVYERVGNDPTIVYPYQYYEEGFVKFHKLGLNDLVWKLEGIEENNYVDINSESSIRDFIWSCPIRSMEFTRPITRLNNNLFSSHTIMVFQSHSAVDFVKYIRDNFNRNTIYGLDRHNFKSDCDARQQKN